MMDLIYRKQELFFIKPAITSRGAYTSKNSWVIELHHNGLVGKGEASPLPDLSVDGQVNLDAVLKNAQEQIREGHPIETVISELQNYPSLVFALQCAQLDLLGGGSGLLFKSPFTTGAMGIRINGLVWMSDIENMYLQAEQKIAQGFSCLKFKVGAQDHDDECRLLEKIRRKYSAFKLEIRLDANGAFAFEEANEMIKDFARFEIHSLEQPIKPGQWNAMAEVCAKSAINIALDEELIGVKNESISSLLNTIKPTYIILKPTLLGGFSVCENWINEAEKMNIGWWVTSALEGNIGLSHIAQWVSTKNTTFAQGLGTGALFKNNFPSDLQLEGETLWFKPAAAK